MGNGERSGSGGRDDWRVRLAGGVGGIVTAALALLARPALGGDLGLWPGTLAFVAVTAAGILLGRFVGSLVFRRPSGDGPRQ